MKQQCEGLRRLRPEEFNATLLERLTRDGRVFVSYPKEINKDAYKSEVLSYVLPIKVYVADEWKGNIDALWQSIVDASPMKDCLAMKKGAQAGHMNRYAVTNLVYWLIGLGVFRNDVSMLQLHLCLERTTKRNKYYTSNGNYAISDEALMFLKRLVKCIK